MKLRPAREDKVQLFVRRNEEDKVQQTTSVNIKLDENCVSIRFFDFVIW